MAETMPFSDLEQVYELLAQTLDEVGENQELLFLSKLTLTMAHQLGDLTTVQEAIVSAKADLDASV